MPDLSVITTVADLGALLNAIERQATGLLEGHPRVADKHAVLAAAGVAGPSLGV
jgi:hypothetical protein